MMKKSIRQIICAGIISSVSSIGIIHAESVDVLLEKGVFLQETKKDYVAAVETYSEALKSAKPEGHLNEILYRMAMCSKGLNDEKTQIEILQGLVDAGTPENEWVQKAEKIIETKSKFKAPSEEFIKIRDILLKALHENDLELFKSVCDEKMKEAMTQEEFTSLYNRCFPVMEKGYNMALKSVNTVGLYRSYEWLVNYGEEQAYFTMTLGTDNKVSGYSLYEADEQAVSKVKPKKALKEPAKEILKIRDTLLKATQENDLELFESVCDDGMKKAMTKEVVGSVSRQVAPLMKKGYETEIKSVKTGGIHDTYEWWVKCKGDRKFTIKMVLGADNKVAGCLLLPHEGEKATSKVKPKKALKEPSEEILKIRDTLLKATQENDLELFESVCDDGMKKAMTKEVVGSVSRQVAPLMKKGYETEIKSVKTGGLHDTYEWWVKCKGDRKFTIKMVLGRDNKVAGCWLR